jgi:hypothetical protein
VDNVTTKTAFFELAVTDLNITLCLGTDVDKNGHVISDRLVPYSFRVEEINNGRFDKLYEVKYIFCKASNAPRTVKYSQMLFGEKDSIGMLPSNILDMLGV